VVEFNLKTEYRTMRSDIHWNTSLTAAKTLAGTLDIEAEFPVQRKKKVPRRLDTEAQSTESVYLDSTDDMKINLYYNTLDRLITELDNRFPPELSDFAFLLPAHMAALDGETRIRRLADRYPQVDSELAVAQWRLARHILAGVDSKIVSLSLREAYVNVPTDFVALRLLYRIALSLCVTTASVERGFSKLAIVKNKLRSTMSQDRLESLVIAAAEKDLLVMIPVDDL